VLKSFEWPGGKTRLFLFDEGNLIGERSLSAIEELGHPIPKPTPETASAID
jgi:hypothetical protein